MTGTQNLLKWFVTLFYNKFEVTLFMSRAFLEVFQINFSLVHIAHCHPSVHLHQHVCPKPISAPIRSHHSTCTAPPRCPRGSLSSVLGHSQHLHVNLSFQLPPAVDCTQLQGLTFVSREPELSSPEQGAWFEQRLSGFQLMAGTANMQHRPFPIWPSTLSYSPSLHCRPNTEESASKWD